MYIQQNKDLILNKELVEVAGTTLPFYKYEKDGLIYFEFNATECTPPEPMINTMKGLSLLKNKTDILVGLFFHEPFPLYARIPLTIEHEAVELANGDIEVRFRKI